MADLETTADVDAFLDAADKAAMRAALDLGTAATTAATDYATAAQGTDARTPTAHASSHLTGGTDAIQPATASVPGLMTAAYASKLDGINTNADVTATVINAADVVTTLNDADKIPVTVAGVLKTIAYSALKTLLDAIYVKTGGALGTPSSGTLTNCTGLPTAGLVDDAVTLAKMAAGTAGNLITYDASGNPAAVATGTAGQVLTSNGAGAAPTMQTPSGGGGDFVQQVYSQDNTYKTTTVAIPSDDTKPQNTEGAAWSEGDTTITPTSATNILCIEVDLMVSASTGAYCTVALFQDSTADALITRPQLITSGSFPFNISFKYFMAAGTTTATTFKIRYGPSNTGYTASLNQAWNTTLFNGTIRSTMRITEIAP